MSAVVIAQDNADTIERCVHSLAFCDEVIVVDGGSHDDTPARARAAGARVVANAWPGYAAQWRFAIDAAAGEWVLVCASDEEVSAALAGEIRAAVEAADPTAGVAGYWCPRRNQFLGRWMDHGPWARDRVLRLFRADRGRVTESRVHEGIVVDGATGQLSGAIHHYTHRTIAESVERMNCYTSLEAHDRVARRRVGVLDALVAPAGVFFKYYVAKGSWRCGVHGFLLSAITAMYKSVLYVKIYLLQRSGTGEFDTRSGLS